MKSLLKHLQAFIFKCSAVEKLQDKIIQFSLSIIPLEIALGFSLELQMRKQRVCRCVASIVFFAKMCILQPLGTEKNKQTNK